MRQLRRGEIDLLPRLGLAVCELGERRPGLTAVLFALLVLLVYGALIDLTNGDLEKLFLIWIDYIRNNGYWAAWKEPFHNFSGPYIYLLTLFTAISDGLLNDLHIAKAVSIFGALFAASIVYCFARVYGDRRIPPIVAAGAFLLIPSVAMNTAAWGQSDIFYTAFLVASLICALKRQIVLMILCFAIAFSIKLQSVFFSPFVLFMMLRHRTNLAWLALIPLTFLVVNLGLVMAGRPLESVLLIYPAQFGRHDVLSMHAPNLWGLLERAINVASNAIHGNNSLHAVAYFPLMIIALVLTVCAALRLAFLGLRRIALDEQDLVAMATLIVTLMPYLLPKMHDRYFFAASVFSFLLFLMRPSLWRIFVCVELGSSLAHLSFLADLGYTMSRAAFLIAPASISIGLFFLLSLVAETFAPRGTGRWQQLFQAYGALPRASA